MWIVVFVVTGHISTVTARDGGLYWLFWLGHYITGAVGCRVSRLGHSLTESWDERTHTFSGPFSRTNQVSLYQKGKTNPDFTEARDNEWQWHQRGHMQVCTSLQTDSHTSTPLLCFYRPDALPAAQPTAWKHWRHSTHWRHSWGEDWCKWSSLFAVKYIFVSHLLLDSTLMRCWCGCLSGARCQLFCVWFSWCHCRP